MKDNASSEQLTLQEHVRLSVGSYLYTVEDDDLIKDLYALVLKQIEAPLLEAVLRRARSNQSVAARMLGMNRGTLRKKLRQYQLL
jgi:Fis family transcriptional regulator